MNIESTLFNDLKSHLLIEFFFNRRNKLFLSEHLTYNGNKSFLFEEYGIFNGCEDIARILVQAVLKCAGKQNVITVTNITNTNWVDEIKVILTSDIPDVGYDSDTSEYENGRMKLVKIAVNPFNISKDELLPTFMHELTHAYQDYNLRLSGSSLYDKSIMSGYNKNKTSYEYDDVNNLPQSYDNLPDNIKQQMKYDLSWILYYINSYEKSAYIASIIGELKDCNRTFSNVKEITEFIRGTQVYKNYLHIFEWGEQFINIKDKRMRDYTLILLSEISNMKFKNYRNFISWLRYNILKIKTKFENTLSKAAYNHLKVSQYLNSPLARDITVNHKNIYQNKY